ncbi:CoA ester lyase [Rhodococcus fascians]|nr:CoA ester lyase [Rhodococcus fascians]MBY4114612.1 CoA ester lyase [Rhodococcus fascians]
MVSAAQTSEDKDGLVQCASTLLFVPGDRPDRFGKAAAAGADIVVLDLEDAVAEKDKATARAHVVHWLSDGGRGCVRINAADGPDHLDDVDALAGLSGLVAVMVPKAVESVDYADLRRMLRCPVIALVESAAGIVDSTVIARDPNVARLAFGHLDYAVDIGARPTQRAMLHARSQLVLASRLAGKPAPIDGVTTALNDPAALLDDVEHAIEVGMAGKLLIHPAQVGPIRRALHPSAEDIGRAQRIVAAASLGAAVEVDGSMVDAPVVAAAQRLLQGLPARSTR